MRGAESLQGRTAIVTGAGSGIGAATARAFLARGARVLLAYPPGDPGETTEIVHEARAGGGEAVARGGDASRPGDVLDLVDACVADLGEPDVAVANAGVADRTPEREATGAEFQRVLAIDLVGPHLLFGACVGSMRARGWGRLLATASTSGHLYGWQGHAAYCAAKAGVVGLVRSYAVDHAAAGVTANAVAPGVVRSPQSLDPVNSMGPEGLEAMASMVPARRVGEPADVAAAFAFLASEEAGYVNGQTLIVDGGLSVLEPEPGAGTGLGSGR